MAGRVFVKDPTTTLVNFGYVIINGFGDGEAVSVERDADEETAVAGVDGDVARIVNPSKLARVTLRLMEGSPANAQLAAVRNLRTPATPKGDQFPFTMTDFGLGEVWTSPEAWISSQPLPSLNGDTPVKEWIITCAYLTQAPL